MIGEQTVEIAAMTVQTRILVAIGIVAGAYLTDFLCCRIIVPIIRRVAARTTFKWDDYLTSGKALSYAFHLIPPIIFYIALPLLFPEQTVWTKTLAKFFSIYIILVACTAICEFISTLYEVSSKSEILKDKPMKGVYQMLKVIVVCIGLILTLGILINKDFTTLIAGLGASAAVLMLIFKDAILGVVAGVQLSAHDMLRPGDWIMIDKHGINGTVEEVALNTVKIRNWDNTIMTIPPYALISDSFKNWRGMRESAGRRVARAIRIDMNSIRFCTEEELERFSAEEWMKEASALGKAADTTGKTTKTTTEPNSNQKPTPVNLTLFRAATEHYLKSLTEVNKNLFLVVRQLEPTAEGLPLQIYFFTISKEWVIHEHIAAEVLEHIIATMPIFGLKPYQRSSGSLSS